MCSLTNTTLGPCNISCFQISKPIYNHVNGTLDTPEEIAPSPIMIIEGLHPMLDDRVAGLLDFSIYLDISDRVKFAWKIQRDMAERGWALEDIKADIEKRKPDFDKYVAPQKAKADMVIEVLPSQIAPPKDENAPCDYLRVRCPHVLMCSVSSAWKYQLAISWVDWPPVE